MLKQKKEKEKKGRGIFFCLSIERFQTTRDSHTLTLRLFVALQRFYFCETSLTPSVTLLEAALLPRHAAK